MKWLSSSETHLTRSCFPTCVCPDVEVWFCHSLSERYREPITFTTVPQCPMCVFKEKLHFFCSIRALEISPNQMTADSLVSGLDHSDKFILTDVMYDVVSTVPDTKDPEVPYFNDHI